LKKDELVVNLELEKKKLEYKCHKCFELEFKVIFTFGVDFFMLRNCYA